MFFQQHLLDSWAMAKQADQTDYSELDPDSIIEAVESLDYVCDKRILALNSYENRVYQIGIEDAKPVIVKFYRPQRWTAEMILEEHQFTQTLAAADIPAVAPLAFDGQTLMSYNAYQFAVYPRFGGYAPELDNPEHLTRLGRLIGRLHQFGAGEIFRHRPEISIDHFANEPVAYLFNNHFIPTDLITSYQSLTDDLIKRIEQAFERAGNVKQIRVHGDCHHGNVLLRDDQCYLVDFDDARNGPAVQDIWMFLSGDRQYMTSRLYDIMDGYTEFCEFDPRELHLIEALRSLRMIHYSGWLAKRWNDPAFPNAFPYFNTQRYWEDQILALREQSALLDEAPLNWRPDQSVNCHGNCYQ